MMINKIWKILVFVIVLISLCAISYSQSDDFFSYNTLFNPPLSTFNYVVPLTNLSNVSFLVHDGWCLNITGGRLAGSRCLEGVKTRFICENNSDCSSGDFCNTTLVCERGVILNLLTCPVNMAGMLNTMLIFLISGFFIATGLIFKAPISGVLGSIMGITSSLFIAACIAIAAYLFALICVACLGYFVTRPFISR